MFRKLMKYEWRATAPAQSLLALASLGVGILGGIILRLMVTFSEEIPDIVGISMGTSLLFMFLAIIGCSAAMWILLLVRFYKNKFTDEGYLTFTLPVNSHHIFLSSALNSLIWLVISFVAIVLAFVAFAAIGLAGLVEWAELQQIMDMISQTFGEIFPSGTAGYRIVTFIQFLLTLPYSVVIAMTCFTVGAAVAKKHKVLAAIGAYYGLSWITGIISSILSLTTTLNHAEWYLSSDLYPQMDYMEQLYHTMMINGIVMIVWQLILMIGGYFLSTHLMSKKLNLP